MGQTSSSGAAAASAKGAAGSALADPYEDPRLQAYFSLVDLYGLEEIVGRWTRGQISKFDARTHVLEKLMKGKSHMEASVTSAATEAAQKGGRGAVDGAEKGRGFARALTATLGEAVQQASAGSSWQPTPATQQVGNAAAEAIGVLGMFAGGVLGGLGHAVNGGGMALYGSREVYHFVDRVFLRSTKDQAWELGAQHLGIEGARPSPETVVAAVQAKLDELLGAPAPEGRPGSSSGSGNLKGSSGSGNPRVNNEPGAPVAATAVRRSRPSSTFSEATWLQLVHLCLAFELVRQLPAPEQRIELTREPFNVRLRLDEEYMHSRMTELSRLIEQQTGAYRGMLKGQINSKCPEYPLPETLEETCPVCLDQLEQGSVVRKLPCGHILHKECCDRWVANSATCPTCRREI